MKGIVRVVHDAADRRNRPSTITATVDFDKPGRQLGYLQLPYSHDAAAYGSVMIPVAVVANGGGPTVLLTGGNHGDEYQGPLSLIKLANSLAPDQLTGRVIIVPCMNQPAFEAGTRTSPIDKGNLNRSFPGRADGTHTERIADYMTRYLLPMSDAVLDIHDGGSTLEFIPMASSAALEDKATEERSQLAAEAFGAPFVTKLVELDTLGMWDFTVSETGRPFVTTELGGTGGTRPELVRITDAGVHNLLVHWGVLDRDPVETPLSQRIVIPEDGGYVISKSEGLLEWLVELGAPISRDQPIARIHEPHRLGTDPIEYRATVDGILAMVHHRGLVKMGDALAMQATIAVPS